MFKINNDSLLVLCVGPLFSWALFAIILGIPVHIGIGIPYSSIALFVAVQCALQIAASPWLFAARATADNPRGKPLQCARVVIVWFMLAGVAAFLQMFNGDFSDRGAVVIFLSTPILFGSISFVALRWLEKRKNAAA